MAGSVTCRDSWLSLLPRPVLGKQSLRPVRPVAVGTRRLPVHGLLQLNTSPTFGGGLEKKLENLMSGDSFSHRGKRAPPRRCRTSFSPASGRADTHHVEEAER